MKKNLALLKVQPGEEQLVGLMTLHAFLFGISIHFTQTAAFALFLAEFKAEALPYVYIINAVVITGLNFSYLKLSRHFSFSFMLRLNLAFLLILTLAVQLGLALSDVFWLVFVLPTLFELLVNLGNLEYWSLAGRLFDLRQSKRLFGLIWAGQWVAVVIGGFLTPFLVRLLGTSNLFWLSVAALAGSLGLLAYLSRSFAGRLEGAESSRSGRRDQPRSLRSGERYIRLIFVLVSLWWVSFFFLDNIFFARAVAQYPQEVQLASFLGLFYAMLGIVALVVSAILTSPILGRYGVRGALLILPLALVAGTGFMIIFGLSPSLLIPLFWITALTKLLDMALGFSLDRTALNILYQPLPAHQRGQVKATAEGIFQPLAIGLAGLLLLGLIQILGFETHQLTYLLLVLVLAWTGVVVLLGREYPRMLLSALTRRYLGGEALFLGDQSSLATLRQALGHLHPDVVFYALDTLEAQGDEILATALPTLLNNHPAPEVREEALARVERLRLAPALAAVRERLERDPVTAVRARALRTWVSLDQTEGIEKVYGYLDAPELPLKVAAIMGLLQHGGIEVSIIAQGRLVQLALSTDAAERIRAAQIIGEIKARNMETTLETLLQDDDVGVRRAALAAAGQAGYPRLWPRIIATLADRRLRASAGAALVAGGPDILLASRETLAHLDRESILRLVRVWGRVGGEQAIALLMEQLTSPDDGVRHQVVLALHRCNYRAGAAQQAPIRDQVEVELAFAADLVATLVDLADKLDLADPAEYQARTLLEEALKRQLKLAQERLLLLLSFVYEQEPLLQARDNLWLASVEKQAYALELIELSVPGSLKPRLFPLLEELTPAQRLERLGPLFQSPTLSLEQRLIKLGQGHNPWVLACTLHLLSCLRVPPGEWIALVQANIGAANPVVAETARSCLGRLGAAEISPVNQER